MDLTRTAYGIWSGGRFMRFGEPLNEERFISVVRHAYDQGIRSFMTADVYGQGAADKMMSKALNGLPRDSYCLVGAVGHDFYDGERQGSKGFPRFTDPALRAPEGYADYLRMATERSLERCGTDRFDLLMLHNPDATGYQSEAVWEGMAAVKEAGLTDRLGLAPGPANGFSLDIILCLERFGSVLDWAMIILNPLEPWPGRLCLPAAAKSSVGIITRVVDYGGLFHDDVKPGHEFREGDHRVFRPQGWVELGNEKLDRMRPIAERHGLTMLQLACLWNLAHEPVRSVIPTFIQEAGDGAKPVEDKIREMASIPDVTLSSEEVEEIAAIGNNKGCMALKGANVDFEGAPEPDRWGLTEDLENIGRRWNIDPRRDLVCDH